MSDLPAHSTARPLTSAITASVAVFDDQTHDCGIERFIDGYEIDVTDAVLSTPVAYLAFMRDGDDMARRLVGHLPVDAHVVVTGSICRYFGIRNLSDLRRRHVCRARWSRHLSGRGASSMSPSCYEQSAVSQSRPRRVRR